MVEEMRMEELVKISVGTAEERIGAVVVEIEMEELV